MIKEIYSKLPAKILDPIKSILRQVLLILLSIAITSILIWIMGYSPLAVFDGLSNGITKDFPGTLRWTTPLILSGLAIAVAFKTGAWNLGVDGQLYMGALAATAVSLGLSTLPGVLLFPITVLAGIIAGMLWALLAGILRTQYGANDLVSSLLLTYVAYHFSDYLIHGPLKSGAYGPAESSNIIPETVWLPKIIEGSSVTIGLIVAIVLAVVLYFLIFRTTLGYELKVVGSNLWFSRYGGIKVKAVYLKGMAISGAISGLIGVIEILGVHHRFPIRFSSGLGFDGIVVSLLASNNPLGVIISGLFFGALRNGSYNIERLTEIPRAMVIIVQAIIVLMVGMQVIIKFKKQKKEKKSSNDDQSKETEELNTFNTNGSEG